MPIPNRILENKPLVGEDAFVYGFKDRARRQLCLGYGTFFIVVDRLDRWRKEYSRRISPITYLPIYVKAMALAVQQHPEANVVLFKGLFGRRIVRFEQIDVNVPVSRTVEAQSLTSIATIRDAPSKSLSRIQQEIRDHQSRLDSRRGAQYRRTPLWHVRWIHERMMWSPRYFIRHTGTCGMTIVDGNSHDYFFPVAPVSLVFGMGARHREPVVEGDRIVIRNRLKCSVMADNFVISGLVGVRVVDRFKELLEEGSFIEDELARGTQHRAVA